MIIAKKKRRVMNDLKAGYAFISLPFIILVFVRFFWEGDPFSVIKAPDWSLASCIIFGQVTASMARAVVDAKETINSSAYNYQTSRRFVYVVLSCLLYFSMLTKPSVWLGCVQLAWFLFASFKYFSDGVAIAMLNDNKSRELD